MQQEENRDWILNLMKETGEKNGANTQYQFWIQDDGAIEISSEKFFHQKINYLHYNPVRAQIVLQPEDYGWSSARLYKKDDTKFLDSLSEIF
jgi:putative transposase